MNSRLDDSHPALERQVHKVSVHDELHRKTGIIRLKHFNPDAICEKQRSFLVVRHPHVQALLTIVTYEFDQTAIGNKRKLSQKVDADDLVILDREFHRARLLAPLVKDVVHPPTDCQLRAAKNRRTCARPAEPMHTKAQRKATRRSLKLTSLGRP